MHILVPAMNTFLRAWNQIEVWFLGTPLGAPWRTNSICGTGCACDETTGCTGKWGLPLD
jgi:hypothetical protein